MRKLFAGTIALALLAVSASPALADTHSFKLFQNGRINGTTLEPGTYKLELNGTDEALIYRGKELVTKAKIEIKSLDNGRTSGSVLVDAKGNVLEVRTKKQVVVFVR
jgi:hypothetical protein